MNGFYAKRVAALIVCLGFILGLFGCAATQVAIEKKDLDVQTKMSETIFLDPVAPENRTIFVNIKNTSDKDLDIAADISNAIAARGYKVVQDPNLAHYMLQANVLSVGKTDPSALRETLVAGYGGPLMGAAVGAAATRSWGGAAAGGLISVRTRSDQATAILLSFLIVTVAFGFSAGTGRPCSRSSATCSSMPQRA